MSDSGKNIQKESVDQLSNQRKKNYIKLKYIQYYKRSKKGWLFFILPIEGFAERKIIHQSISRCRYCWHRRPSRPWCLSVLVMFVISWFWEVSVVVLWLFLLWRRIKSFRWRCRWLVLERFGTSIFIICWSRSGRWRFIWCFFIWGFRGFWIRCTSWRIMGRFIIVRWWSFLKDFMVFMTFMASMEYFMGLFMGLFMLKALRNLLHTA